MIFIPKKIHFIWIGTDKCPFEDNIRTYIVQNPKWEVKIWKDKDLFPLHNKYTYNKMNSWAGKADVIRLEILYRFGGIYVDTDSRCVKPLDGLVDNLFAFGMQAHTGKINNCMLGCTINHPAFERLVYEMRSHVDKLAKTAKNKKKGIGLRDIAGSGFITPILRADETYTQLDKGKARGARELVGSEMDYLAVKNGYILQYPAQSWVNKKQRRVVL